MPDHLQLFEAERPRLVSLGYRLLGSASRAEDGVQEAWLRWSGVDLDAIRAPQAFLTTIMTRWCLDELRSARHRRETYVGPWLPEPIPTASEDISGADVVARETLSLGFLLLLEALSPLERAVFVLREVFEYDHGEIATMVGRRRDHCRQLLRRAKGRLEAAGMAPRASLPEEEAAFARLSHALQAGDPVAFVAALTEDAVLLSDGGGVVSAALRPLRGPDVIGRFLFGLKKRSGDAARIEAVTLNGGPGALIFVGDALAGALAVEVEGGVISRIYMIRNPEKLGAVGAGPSEAP